MDDGTPEEEGVKKHCNTWNGKKCFSFFLHFFVCCVFSFSLHVFVTVRRCECGTVQCAAGTWSLRQPGAWGGWGGARDPQRAVPRLR